MRNPQFTVSENMSSTENTVFHSNLHYLLNEGSIILGFSTDCSMLSRHHY